MANTKRKLDEVIEYIITWLCYGDSEAAKRVAYSADEKELETHDVLIVPNGKLGNHIVLPEMERVETPSGTNTIVLPPPTPFWVKTVVCWYRCWMSMRANYSNS